MFGNISKQAKLAGAVIFALLVLAIGGVAAAPHCQTVSGQFTLQPLTGPTCLSAVGICATGVYRGGINGDSSFTASSVIQTADTPTTAVILVTGDNLIQTAHGDLLTKDAVVLKTTGAGEFAEVDTIVSGTGDWAGATGTITATGTFTTSDGGDGHYTGEVCTQ